MCFMCMATINLDAATAALAFHRESKPEVAILMVDYALGSPTDFDVIATQELSPAMQIAAVASLLGRLTEAHGMTLDEALRNLKAESDSKPRKPDAGAQFH